MLRWIARGMIVGAIAATSLPVNAQSCSPLRVVGGTGYQVQKTVSVPSAGPITRNNWNTDFTLGGQTFGSYVATIMPKDGGTYTIQMNLKYPNETVDKVYDEKLELKKGQPLKITGSSRIYGKPYQVNLSVGGVEAVGTNYTASVAGCR